METPQKIFVAIGTAAVVGLAVFGGSVLFGAGGATQNNNSQAAPAANENSSQSSNQATAGSTAAQTAASYKDGQYTATQNYYVPHGESNSIAVTLTVANGKISAVKVNDQYTDRESGMYISDFESGVSNDANGQSLSSYSPSRIAGASLTTEAFAQAIDNIKSQAAA